MKPKQFRQEILPSWPDAEWERFLRRNEAERETGRRISRSPVTAQEASFFVFCVVGFCVTQIPPKPYALLFKNCLAWA